MPIATTPFDPAKYLSTSDDHVELLLDALASGHDGYIDNAVAVVIQARDEHSVQGCRDGLE